MAQYDNYNSRNSSRKRNNGGSGSGQNNWRDTDGDGRYAYRPNYNDREDRSSRSLDDRNRDQDHRYAGSHTSTQDFRNNNATRFNRGMEGDLDWRPQDYDQQDYRNDYSDHLNYGERYGNAAYGRAQYNADQNRGYDSSNQSWRENQSFNNREQDYRGGRWSKSSHEYERNPSSSASGSYYGSRYSSPNSSSGNQAWYGGSNGNRQGDSTSRSGYGMMEQYGGMSDHAPGEHSGKGPKNYSRSDSRIQEDVCERLMQHSQVDASDIDVAVKSGEVTLSGSVSNRAMKHMAEDAIEGVQGVREVTNQIRVSQQPLASSNTTSSTSTKSNDRNSRSSNGNGSTDGNGSGVHSEDHSNSKGNKTMVS